jgi:hypothetical protein
MARRQIVHMFTVAALVQLTSLSALAQPSNSYRLLMQNVLINADYWDEQPKIIGAGLGFTQIIGVPLFGNLPAQQAERVVRHAGGTWNFVSQPDSPLRAYTSAVTPQNVAMTFGYPVTFRDGFPIEFSWPVLPKTVQPTDFQVVLSNGTCVAPDVVSISPNLEYNERSTVVIFGTFGNRITPGNRGSIYPVQLRILRDATPLTLAGPNGRTASAVGMTYGDRRTPMTAYQPGKGPTLVAAKLSVMSTLGESAPAIFSGTLPNDGVALYGPAARYRLRMMTTGGFSPDGVRAIYPTEFSRYFRLQARGSNGNTILITQTGVDYFIDGHRLRVLGLADLGLKQDTYEDGYQVDNDNYIDIVMDGDIGAMRRITYLEIPAVAPYSPLYNPGGPGNDPTPGVVYSQPSPALTIPVRIALDNPMTVFYGSAIQD